MSAKVTVVALCFAVASVACSKDDERAARPVPCIPVTNELLLGATRESALWAVEAEHRYGDYATYYVSARDGATWLTDLPLEVSEDVKGVWVLPMNDAARRASDTGAVSPPDVAERFSDDEPEAKGSRDCARRPR